MTSLVQGLSFGKSIVFGSENQTGFDICGLKIIFIDDRKPLENSISNVIYQVFSHVFPVLTLQYASTFVLQTSRIVARKIFNVYAPKEFIITGSGRSGILDSENELMKASIKSPFLSKTIILIGILSRLIFSLSIFIAARALVGYITTPIALGFAASSIFQIAKHIFFVSNARILGNPLNSTQFGWKANAALVATYALSLFAAYKMI